MEPTTLIGLTLLTLFLATLLSKRRRSALPLPPGPRRLPVIGNLFNRPIQKPWLAYEAWKVSYGDLVYLEVLKQPIVVVNSASAANELFEKRSSIYADRPPFHMANDLMGWGWDFAHMRYSETWRLHRKMFHQFFQPIAVPSYYDIQMNATRTLLTQMLDSPERFSHHIRHHAGSIILKIVYGYDVQLNDDPNVTLADKAIRQLADALIPGGYLVDYLPILKRIPSWFPFAEFQRFATDAKINSLMMRDKPFDNLLKLETPPECFATSNINRIEALEAETHDKMMGVLRNTAGLAFGAGADTTVSLVLTTILALVNNPDIQSRAHAELDSIVGRTRMPDFEDQQNLKFIQAIILEAMRWRPVTPLAIAHAALSDDIYEGYFIPAESIVFGNTWAILHDETLYTDANNFNPDRFMGENPAPNPMNHGAFGFGRRICPGRYLAINSTYIAVASLLWAFELRPLKEGTKLDEDDYSDGLLAHPHPFECRFVPRFKGVDSMIDV